MTSLSNAFSKKERNLSNKNLNTPSTSVLAQPPTRFCLYFAVARAFFFLISLPFGLNFWIFLNAFDGKIVGFFSLVIVAPLKLAVGHAGIVYFFSFLLYAFMPALSITLSTVVAQLLERTLYSSFSDIFLKSVLIFSSCFGVVSITYASEKPYELIALSSLLPFLL